MMQGGSVDSIKAVGASFCYIGRFRRKEQRKREKAYTLGERYTPLRKKNVMYVIGEVILLPRLLIWNIHRIVIVEAGLAQWQVADHRLKILNLHIS